MKHNHPRVNERDLIYNTRRPPRFSQPRAEFRTISVLPYFWCLYLSISLSIYIYIIYLYIYIYIISFFFYFFLCVCVLIQKTAVHRRRIHSLGYEKGGRSFFRFFSPFFSSFFSFYPFCSSFKFFLFFA